MVKVIGKNIDRESLALWHLKMIQGTLCQAGDVVLEGQACVVSIQGEMISMESEVIFVYEEYHVAIVLDLSASMFGLSLELPEEGEVMFNKLARELERAVFDLVNFDTSDFRPTLRLTIVTGFNGNHFRVLLSNYLVSHSQTDTKHILKLALDALHELLEENILKSAPPHNLSLSETLLNARFVLNRTDSQSRTSILVLTDGVAQLPLTGVYRGLVSQFVRDEISVGFRVMKGLHGFGFVEDSEGLSFFANGTFGEIDSLDYIFYSKSVVGGADKQEKKNAKRFDFKLKEYTLKVDLELLLKCRIGEGFRRIQKRTTNCPQSTETYSMVLEWKPNLMLRYQITVPSTESPLKVNLFVSGSLDFIRKFQAKKTSLSIDKTSKRPAVWSQLFEYVQILTYTDQALLYLSALSLKLSTGIREFPKEWWEVLGLPIVLWQTWFSLENVEIVCQVPQLQSLMSEWSEFAHENMFLKSIQSTNGFVSAKVSVIDQFLCRVDFGFFNIQIDQQKHIFSEIVHSMGLLGFHVPHRSISSLLPCKSRSFGTKRGSRILGPWAALEGTRFEGFIDLVVRPCPFECISQYCKVEEDKIEFPSAVSLHLAFDRMREKRKCEGFQSLRQSEDEWVCFKSFNGTICIFELQKIPSQYRLCVKVVMEPGISDLKVLEDDSSELLAVIVYGKLLNDDFSHSSSDLDALMHKCPSEWIPNPHTLSLRWSDHAVRELEISCTELIPQHLYCRRSDTTVLLLNPSLTEPFGFHCYIASKEHVEMPYSVVSDILDNIFFSQVIQNIEKSSPSEIDETLRKCPSVSLQMNTSLLRAGDATAFSHILYPIQSHPLLFIVNDETDAFFVRLIEEGISIISPRPHLSPTRQSELIRDLSRASLRLILPEGPFPCAKLIQTASNHFISFDYDFSSENALSALQLSMNIDPLFPFIEKNGLFVLLDPMYDRWIVAETSQSSKLCISLWMYSSEEITEKLKTWADKVFTETKRRSFLDQLHRTRVIPDDCSCEIRFSRTFPVHPRISSRKAMEALLSGPLSSLRLINRPDCFLVTEGYGRLSSEGTNVVLSVYGAEESVSEGIEELVENRLDRLVLGQLALIVSRSPNPRLTEEDIVFLKRNSDPIVLETKKSMTFENSLKKLFSCYDGMFLYTQGGKGVALIDCRNGMVRIWCRGSLQRKVVEEMILVTAEKAFVDEKVHLGIQNSEWGSVWRFMEKAVDLKSESTFLFQQKGPTLLNFRKDVTSRFSIKVCSIFGVDAHLQVHAESDVVFVSLDCSESIDSRFIFQPISALVAVKATEKCLRIFCFNISPLWTSRIARLSLKLVSKCLYLENQWQQRSLSKLGLVNPSEHRKTSMEKWKAHQLLSERGKLLETAAIGTSRLQNALQIVLASSRVIHVSRAPFLFEQSMVQRARESFLHKYLRYTSEVLGFSLLCFEGPETSKGPKVYLRKVVKGFPVFLELGFKGSFACLNMYLAEMAEDQTDSVSDSSGGLHTELIPELTQLSTKTRLHAFLYDFHLQQVSTLLRKGVDEKIAGVLQVVSQYFENIPAFSRNVLVRKELMNSLLDDSAFVSYVQKEARYVGWMCGGGVVALREGDNDLVCVMGDHGAFTVFAVKSEGNIVSPLVNPREECCKESDTGCTIPIGLEELYTCFERDSLWKSLENGTISKENFKSLQGKLESVRFTSIHPEMEDWDAIDDVFSILVDFLPFIYSSQLHFIDPLVIVVCYHADQFLAIQFNQLTLFYRHELPSRSSTSDLCANLIKCLWKSISQSKF